MKYSEREFRLRYALATVIDKIMEAELDSWPLGSGGVSIDARTLPEIQEVAERALSDNEV